MRLFITGFGPFPGVKDNPSARLVRHIAMLDQKTGFLEHVICHTHILPTEWGRAGDELAQQFAAFKPDMALHFGYSPQARGLVLERLAHNRRCGSPDAKGRRMACTEIEPGAPARLETFFDLNKLINSPPPANCDFQLSDDAGTYLCNEIYFRSLRLSKTALFVHIPALQADDEILPSNHGYSLKIGTVASAVQILSTACLQQLKQRARGDVT